MVGAATCEVAEELSIWNAIKAAPRRLSRVEGAEFDAFCSLLIKALEVANAHWGTLVGLGLSPVEWSEVVSLNTAKKLSAFVRSAGDIESGPNLAAWERAWQQRPVPGFASASELWSSPLGFSLRSKALSSAFQPVLGDTDVANDAHVDDQTPEGVVDRANFQAVLATLAKAGVLDRFDVWLLKHLEAGKKISQLTKSPRVLVKFGARNIPDSYVEDLLQRIRKQNVP
jgi:hypothetical protein